MKNKGVLLLCSSLALMMILTACSTPSSSSSSGTNAAGTSRSQDSTSLSQVNTLLVGTLKLEDTDQAVTADEAAKLLPLWQAYRSLSNSQTAAEAEVDGLLNQIETTMTTEQAQAIQNMNLKSADMMDMTQSLGPSMGPQGTPDPKATPGVDFPSGGVFTQGGGPPEGFNSSGNAGSSGGTRPNPPSGGMIISGGPGGDAGSAAGLGGGPMVQGTQDPSMQATAQARFSTQASQVNLMLLNVLINKLEGKTGSSQPTPTPTPIP